MIDRGFISSELRLSKPDPAVFPAITARLDVQPDEVAFIDDRQECVDAASDHGWLSHLWVDDADSLIRRGSGRRPGCGSRRGSP
ncbi:MAG TPA: hypothetical protein DCM67_04310 [Propionibacteriaceae bacterium]|nr:hypothetical protein [Propionibacteriaceae bacterium]